MNWFPGDDPTTHPLWEKQVELERRMLRHGSNQYQARLARAKQRRNAAHLKPQRSLVRAWLPPMVEGIKDSIRDMRLHRGVRPVSLPYLMKLDAHLTAYITLREVLNTIATSKGTGIMLVAGQIGLALEHEARMREWEKRDPKLYYGVQRSLKRQGATTEWRGRVNINRFNKLLREKLEWQDWPAGDRKRIGLDLIDILCRYVKQFQMVTDPRHLTHGGLTKAEFKKQGIRTSAPWVLEGSDELLEWLERAHDRAALLSPLYQPTLIPPRRWEGTRDGGYYTEFVRAPQLIRFKAHEEDQARFAADEYDALDMPKVYAALHAIQEVPWRVNECVLDIALRCWKRDLAIAGLPLREAEPLPPEAGDDAPEELIKEAKRQRRIVRSRNARRVSSVLATDRMLQVAQQFRGETFYFPHFLDFRGRMYPIPVDFQPQGRDLARGLLTFAEGRPVDKESAGWLAIHLANCFGFDKAPFDDRIAWVAERLEKWMGIAHDPMAHREWADADSPWQALAAVFEWIAYLENGEGYVSHLPVRVDGTCNGLQHLSAMTRDERGGTAVNLVPSARPQDIYQRVADRLTFKLYEIKAEGGEPSENAAWWLDLCDGKLPRSLTKRPVMILPYGATKDAYFRYTREWLDDAAGQELAPKERGRYVAFLVNHLWDGVAQEVAGAVRVMQWLQDCAKLAARGDQPVFWITSDGFVVRHFYGKTIKRKVECKINGEKFEFVNYEFTKRLDVRQQLKGIPPNFVHSLDATAARLTIVKAKAQGITSLTAIHDAFGALAGDMWALYGTIREAFVEAHSVDVLGEFRRACQSVLADHIAFQEREDRDVAFARADRLLPQPLATGTLDISRVLDSDYFFA